MTKDKARESLIKMCDMRVKTGDWYGYTNRHFIYLTKDYLVTDNDVTTILNDMKPFDKKLEIPTVKELKRQKMEMVGRKRPRELKYSFGEGKPVVAMQYLLPILEALDNPIAYYKKENFPVFFVSADALVVLCPLFMGKGYKQAKGVFLTESEKGRILGG